MVSSLWIFQTRAGPPRFPAGVHTTGAWGTPSTPLQPTIRVPSLFVPRAELELWLVYSGSPVYGKSPQINHAGLLGPGHTGASARRVRWSS